MLNQVPTLGFKAKKGFTVWGLELLGFSGLLGSSEETGFTVSGLGLIRFIGVFRVLGYRVTGFRFLAGLLGLVRLYCLGGLWTFRGSG